MRNLHLVPLFGLLFASLAAYAEPATEKSNGLDGGALYAEHCIECHGRAAVSPSLSALSNMTAEDCLEFTRSCGSASWRSSPMASGRCGAVDDSQVDRGAQTRKGHARCRRDHVQRQDAAGTRCGT